MIMFELLNKIFLQVLPTPELGMLPSCLVDMLPSSLVDMLPSQQCHTHRRRAQWFSCKDKYIFITRSSKDEYSTKLKQSSSV